MTSYSSVVFAKDQALLVAVNEYKHKPEINFSGMENDLVRMREILWNLGFLDDQIKELSGTMATRANIIQEINALTKKISKKDRLLFYYTGHGSKIKDQDGDESDGLDEMLLTYDSRFEMSLDSDERLPTSGLRDDMFYQLISKSPTQDNFIIIDSCFSRTAVRGAQSISSSSVRFVVHPISKKKLITKSYLPKSLREKVDCFLKIRPQLNNSNFIALSAAGDCQEALFLKKDGSLFTKALHESVKESLLSGDTFNFKNFLTGAQSYLHNYFNDGDNPQLQSYEHLPGIFPKNNGLEKKILLAFEDQQARQLLHLVMINEGRLQIEKQKTKFEVFPDYTAITVKKPNIMHGYLNVVCYDNGQITLLEDNVKMTVGADALRRVELQTQGPLGKIIVAAFLTEHELSLTDGVSYIHQLQSVEPIATGLTIMEVVAKGRE